MTEENKQIKISDILRQTVGNTHQLMMHIADHIDKLEAQIVELSNRVSEIEGRNSDSV